MTNLEQERKAFMSVLNELDYDEGIVLGSYVGKLEQQNKRYREFLEDMYNHAYGLQLYPHVVDQIKELLEEME